MTAIEGVATAGAPLASATAAVILLHGRGATAAGILSLADVLAKPDIACLAPQAPGGTWYPYSFLAPIGRNEPSLSRSLATIRELVDDRWRQGRLRRRHIREAR